MGGVEDTQESAVSLSLEPGGFPSSSRGHVKDGGDGAGGGWMWGAVLPHSRWGTHPVLCPKCSLFSLFSEARMCVSLFIKLKTNYLKKKKPEKTSRGQRNTCLSCGKQLCRLDLNLPAEVGKCGQGSKSFQRKAKIEAAGSQGREAFLPCQAPLTGLSSDGGSGRKLW